MNITEEEIEKIATSSEPIGALVIPDSKVRYACVWKCSYGYIAIFMSNYVILTDPETKIRPFGNGEHFTLADLMETK